MSQSLVLMRHGQSEWNARNRFTGWADPDLTATGEREAAAAGRDYGALQGWGKDEAVREYGEEQVLAWRRSYAVAPRAASPFATSPPGCCRTGTTRSSQTCAPVNACWVVSHGNTLRAPIKHLDGIGDDEIAGLEIPNGVPLCYQLDPHMRPVARGGRRLVG